MFTTSHFQVKPNFYNSKKECTNSYKKRINTNSRYKFFFQTHFTAGDIEQFEKYRDPTNGESHISDVDLTNNMFEKEDVCLNWEKYHQINNNDVTNTFNYIFYKFKKGIFVKIKNNKLKVFLPFSNKNFVNEWAAKIQIHPQYGNMVNFVKYIYQMEGRNFHPNSINKFTESWYSNNYLLRYEFPISEGDTNVPIMCDMLQELCENRKIPDMEFFVNRRDFPILKRDGTEPYEHLYDGKNVPLISHNYKKYSPIFSMTTNDKFADLLFPTGDDWSRIGFRSEKFFPHSRIFHKDDYNNDWYSKKPTAVFRGSSTGDGVTVNTNTRLKLVKISMETCADEDGIPFIDAGITSWNLRPRKLMGKKYLKTIDIHKIPFKLVKPLTPKEQSNYKYIINVDGHVTAYRLSYELGMGCCIILVKSKYNLWFSNMLKPYVHYVPVKEDLSNIIDQIKWCRKNDDKCKKISENAKQFYNTYLQKEGMLDYIQKILIDAKKQSGFYMYNVRTPLQIQLDKEREFCLNDLEYPDTPYSIDHICSVPKQKRTYSLLRGFQYIIYMIIDNMGDIDMIKEKKSIFENSSTKIILYEEANYPFIVKSTNKTNESIHESFVGLSSLNNLSKEIPNFAYIFGYFEKDNYSYIIEEYIEGYTLYEYIKSDKFNVDDYINILIQLAYALEIAQRRYGFVHYDLAPWNIIIRLLDKPETFSYSIGTNEVYKITTQFVPVIIDYGKTHIIHKQTHYGYAKPYKMSTIQDMLSILLLTLYEVCIIKIRHQDIEKVLKLANFFTGTRYRFKKFVFAKNGLNDLKYFLRKQKKYSTLLEGDKYELEKLSPKHFIEYIKSCFKYNYIKRQQYFTIYNIGCPTQVFNYILSNNIQGRINSYVNVIDSEIVFTPVKYISLKYFMIQTIYIKIKTTYNLLIDFLKENGEDTTQYNDIFTEQCKIITKYQYTDKHNLSMISIPNYKYDSQLYVAPYDYHTFTNIDVMNNVYKQIINTDVSSNVINIRYVLQNILNYNGKCSLSHDIRKMFFENFKDLLGYNPTIIINNSANLKTYEFIAQEICKNDVKFLEKSENYHITEIAKYKKYIKSMEK